jgi:hypothetical protein
MYLVADDCGRVCDIYPLIHPDALAIYGGAGDSNLRQCSLEVPSESLLSTWVLPPLAVAPSPPCLVKVGALHLSAWRNTAFVFYKHRDRAGKLLQILKYGFP